MTNSSQVSYFELVAYFDTGVLKYLYFTIVMSLYCLIVGANVLLIVVICKNRSLHEPMYLFLCSLFVNELFGSTALFPFLLIQILSDIHIVSPVFCFLQIFSVHSYGSVEYFTLAVMAYDRYLAICHPLEYHTRMTFKKVVILTAFVWSWSAFNVLVMMSLSTPLQRCGNTIQKVYCDNYAVVKLACGDTTVNNIYGLVKMFTMILFLIVLVFYSYMRILKICFSGSKQTRKKAVSTCVPHLASLLNFIFGSFFEIVQGRFDMSSAPMTLRIFLSLYWLVCQPLFNPLMYGLNITKIRIICKSLVFGKTI